ncbi:MAG: serine--tRNA ligase [Candidatus Aenigmarchaeota archaeon]|nr:serine--tRNA ligase [Candidatus Aenigmarchaeota archaeon]
MLDIKLIRENPDFVRKNLEKRENFEKIKLFEELLEKDRERMKLKKEVENLKHEKNLLTKEISIRKNKGENITSLIEKVSEISKEIESKEKELNIFNKRCKEILLQIPNLIHETVPIGNENVEIRRWGSPPKFDFKPKNHLEILKEKMLIDDERAGKIAGRGFFYLYNNLALLDLALIRFAIDRLIKKGYRLIIPPYMMRKEAYKGATDFEFFHEQLYKIEDEDLYLIATAEHPIAAMFMNETFLASQLPLKIVAVSPCFRKEVGAHGKYTKGLFRMHQFHKVEQFVFCLPNQSWEMFEEIQKNAEELYQELGLYYRVVNICTADLGDFASKKYDIEIWMSDGIFREAGSNSNCTDYQARRLNIKYREKEGQLPKGFVHTLNSTAIATSRTMIAIIEQYQRENGDIIIPKVLQEYMNGIDRI